MSRTLDHGDLVDLKYAADRARMALAELPAAINEGDDSVAYSLLGSLSSDLHTIIRNLKLDDIDDDEPDDTVSQLERITRNGGRDAQ